MFSPAATREGTVAAGVHASHDAEDGNDRTGKAQDIVAILDDGPEDNEQEEALPGVAGGPTQ